MEYAKNCLYSKYAAMEPVDSNNFQKKSAVSKANSHLPVIDGLHAAVSDRSSPPLGPSLCGL